MTLSDLVHAISEGIDLTVEGVPLTFESVEEVKLPTGDMLYLAFAESGTLLSVDPSNEECYLLDRCDEDMDLSEDLQVFNGSDYEFSTEEEGRVMVDDDLADGLLIRDYQASNGRIIRGIEYQGTGDLYIFEGKAVSEDDIVESA